MAAGVLVVIAVVVGAVLGNLTSSGGSGSSASAAAAVASPAPHCYYSVEDTLGGNPFTIAILGVSDCTNYAVGNSEFLVLKINVPKGAGKPALGWTAAVSA
jgi:hypothetical protein